MRRACLFLLLVIGWSILLMAQDRDGRNGQVAQAQAFCSGINDEFTCNSTEGCEWDPVFCECVEVDIGCDPIERASCLPPCEWDEEVCECFCPDPCGTYTAQVSSEYEFQECKDGKLLDCLEECVTTYTYDECTDEQIDESTECQKDCVWDGLSCC
jgi:hypothetical protein